MVDIDPGNLVKQLTFADSNSTDKNIQTPKKQKQVRFRKPNLYDQNRRPTPYLKDFKKQVN